MKSGAIYVISNKRMVPFPIGTIRTTEMRGLMSELLEVLMLVSFGLSWPPAIYTALTKRTAKGKNVLFDVFIWFGYFFGIGAKIVAHSINYTMIFYGFNFLAATLSILLYFRNRRLDAQAE